MIFGFEPQNFLFDSHCHLYDKQFDNDRENVIKNAIQSGVQKIVDVATDVESAKKILDYSARFSKNILPTVGIHPEVFVPGSDLYKETLDSGWIDSQILEIDNLLKSNPGKFFMIGECGMDLYWLKKNNVSAEVFEHSKKFQSELFTRQVELAKTYGLPLTVHSREALDDCLAILDKYSDVKAIMHSFTGDYEQAKKILDQGLAIGINGIITYSSAQELRSTIQKIVGTVKEPVDLYNKHIYLETDSPYLGVGELRGKRNQPKIINLLFESI